MDVRWKRLETMGRLKKWSQIRLRLAWIPFQAQRINDECRHKAALHRAR